MLHVKKSILRKEEFLKKMQGLSCVKLTKLKTVLNDIENMLDSSEDSIAFLHKLDELTDESVQMSCRGVVISHMYDVPCRDVSWSACNHDLLMVNVGNTSTAIVSKYGEMLIKEGKITTGRFDHGEFVARSVSDGKIGYFSRTGTVILPCIFDDCDMHIGEANFLLKGVNFRLVTISSSDASSINDLLRNMNKLRWGIICMTEDKKTCFGLSQMDLLKDDHKYEPKTREEKDAAINFITSVMSDRILDIEKVSSPY